MALKGTQKLGPIVVTAAASAARKVGLARKKRPVVIARGKARLSAAGKVTIKVKLTRKARRKLRRARRLRVTVATKFKDAAGRTTTKRRVVTLKR